MLELISEKDPDVCEKSVIMFCSGIALLFMVLTDLSRLLWREFIGSLLTCEAAMVVNYRTTMVSGNYF